MECPERDHRTEGASAGPVPRPACYGRPTVRDGGWQGAAWAAATGALALAVAIAAPGAPRAIATTLLVAVAGAGAVRAAGVVGRGLDGLPRPPAIPWAVPGVLALGVAVLGPGLLAGARAGDFGVHRVVVETLADGFAAGELRRWTHLVGAGMPLDLYPRVAYLPAALLVWPLGLSSTAALSVVASASHVALAAAAAAVARRVAGEGWAFALGALALLDRGVHHETLGVFAIFRAALFHQALSMAAFGFAAAGLLDGLRAPDFEAPRRTARRAARVALLVAVAVALHPLALVSAATALLAAAGVALFARDVSPLRALVAARDVALGLALGAPFWLPLVLALQGHGLAFGSSAADAADFTAQLVDARLPHLSFRLVAALAFLGAIAAFASRRAAPWFLAALATVPVLLYAEEAWTWTGLAPGTQVAGFPAQRMGGLARPFAFGLAAYAGSAAVAGARGGVQGRRRLGWIAAAVAALVVALAARGTGPRFEADARGVRRARARPAPAELAELVTWARARVAELPRDRVARVLLPRSVTWQHAVAAASGLPLVHLGYAPGSAFRDHPADAAAAANRRFDVRWTWEWDAPPGRRGAGVTRIGPHALVEVPGWDGVFARVEGGAGEARLVRLGDDEIVLDVDAAAPVDVVLGMPWWPRWRAVDAGERSLPVEPVPAFAGAGSRVPSVRAPPGRVVLRCDRLLPWDLAGIAVALVGLVAWRLSWLAHVRRRWRLALRGLAVRIARAARRRRRGIAVAGAAAVVAVAAGLALAPGDARGLYPPGGFFTGVDVAARAGPAAPWRSCRHEPLEGAFSCPGGGRVGPAMIPAFQLRPGAWPSVAPATGVDPRGDPDAEYRVRFPHRIEGLYRLGQQGRGSAVLRGVGAAPLDVRSVSAPVRLAADGTAELLLRPEGERLFVAIVRNDTLGSAAAPAPR